MGASEVESILNSKLLANHFKELCLNFLAPHKESCQQLNQEKSDNNGGMVFFLARVSHLIKEGKVDAETFKNEIKKMKDSETLQVEILWYLEILKILSLTEYIRFHEYNESEGIILKFSNEVFENILEYKPNSNNLRAKMLIDFMKTLSECIQQKNGHKVSFFRTLVHLIATNLHHCFTYEEENYNEKFVQVSYVLNLLLNANFQTCTIKLFLEAIISALLESSIQTPKSIFKQQEEIKNKVKNMKIFHFFSTISEFCNLEFFLEGLQCKLTVTTKGLNWNYTLCLITFIGSCKNGWSELKALSNSLLHRAFKSLDVMLLSHAFLVARQGCLEKLNNSFPSYVQWFGSTFSSESKKLISCRKICEFFLNFLAELLPSDPTYYSKVHINKMPWVPTDCVAHLNDYVALVKTQLRDLNVSVELGICENLTNKSTPVFDVEMVLQHFERTNTILNSVFEASMFCRDYYEKRFLPELLRKFEGKKSTRHKLILKLYSLGKIPNSMIKMYKTLEKK